jgi:hypothetical protein
MLGRMVVPKMRNIFEDDLENDPFSYSQQQTTKMTMQISLVEP